MKVYESTHVKGSLNPVFPINKSKLNIVANGDSKTKVKFSFLNFRKSDGNHSAYGSFISTFKEISKGKREFNLIGGVGGTVKFEMCNVV